MTTTIARGMTITLLAIATAGCGWQSQSEVVPSPQVSASAVVTESGVRRILSALAHDSMEGRRTGTPGANRAAAFIAAEMRAIGLTPAGDSGYFQQVPLATGGRRGITLLESTSALDTVPKANRRIDYNMIGVIRGSDPVLRDEVVVIGAHYDHVGIGKPVDGDSIYNGADDDASGVTAVLSIARAIAAGPPPKRTIVFATMTGEEMGMLGTRWYVQHPAFPIAQTVADMQIEMIGRPDSMAGGPGKAWLTGYERSTMGEMLKAADIPIVPDPYPAMRFFERSDNIVFARAGIPAHTLSSYNMHKDYHQPSDDVTKIDFAHMTAVITSAVAATRLLADGAAPRWNEGGRP